MENGYYLSTYLEINELANLYSFAERHDHNVSLWRLTDQKVELIHYWELERVTGNKHHRHACFNVDEAKKLLNELLSTYDLSLEDMVEIWGTPQLETVHDYHSIEDFPGFTYHSISHLFSTVMFDTEIFNNNTVIGFSVDLGSDSIIDKNAAEKIAFTGCVVNKGEIEVFPIHSPGLLWGAARSVFGLEEGTLMALCSASTSQALFENENIEVITTKSRLESVEYIKQLYDKVKSFTSKEIGTLFSGYDPRFTIEENNISMVMKKIQKLSCQMMDYNIDKIIEQYDIQTSDAYLAMSGGFSLNCPTNSHLMRKYKFKSFVAPPCVSDTGQSLGIALYAFFKKKRNFDFKMEHAYYGDRDLNLKDLLINEEYVQFINQVSEFNAEQAARDIQDSPIAWFDGAAEVGPRALGNRSLLSDPRTQLAKDSLNKIKDRQWWRPVAPIVLEEDIDEWFEDAHPSPFMLHTFKIKERVQDLIPAVAHLDGTARVQTIDKSTSLQKLYKLIEAYKEQTGVPIICNTSLNDKGEPVINKIEEVLNFALRKGIKVVYVNGTRIQLHNSELYKQDKPHPRPVSFKLNDSSVLEWKQKLNPHDIPLESIYYFVMVENRVITEALDIKDKFDARQVCIRTQIYKNKEKITSADEIIWN
ncbi:Decarbamoylnovobiocin carbamoyltransferase [compost metagenome]